MTDYTERDVRDEVCRMSAMTEPYKQPKWERDDADFHVIKKMLIQLADMLAEREKADPVAWRPMSSAPRDGSVIDLRWGSDAVTPGWWTGDVATPAEHDPSDEYLWQFIDAKSSEFGEYFLNLAKDNEYGPTHWRPYTHPAAQPRGPEGFVFERVNMGSGDERYAGLSDGSLGTTVAKDGRDEFDTAGQLLWRIADALLAAQEGRSRE